VLLASASLSLTSLSLSLSFPAFSCLLDRRWTRIEAEKVCVGRQVEEQESQGEAGQVNEPLFTADWISSFCVFAGVCV
jgi:hypothetical protein